MHISTCSSLEPNCLCIYVALANYHVCVWAAELSLLSILCMCDQENACFVSYMSFWIEWQIYAFLLTQHGSQWCFKIITMTASICPQIQSVMGVTTHPPLTGMQQHFRLSLCKTTPTRQPVWCCIAALTVVWKCMFSAYRVCVLWNSSFFFQHLV